MTAQQIQTNHPRNYSAQVFLEPFSISTLNKEAKIL